MTISYHTGSSRAAYLDGASSANRGKVPAGAATDEVAANSTETAGAGETVDTADISATARRLAKSRQSLELGERAFQLQTHGDRLGRMAGILARVGELTEQNAAADAAEGETTEAEAEFAQLQQEAAVLNRATTGAGGAGPRVSSLVDDFSTLDNWESTAGSAAVGDGNLLVNAGGYYGAAQSKATVGGAMEIKFDLFLPGAIDSLDLSIGGTTISNLTDTLNTTKWNWHSVRIVYDGSDTASTYLDGSDTAADTKSGLGSLQGGIGLANLGLGSALIRNFSLTATSTGTTDEESSLAAIVGAQDLDGVDAETVTDAMDELAAAQAENQAAIDATAAEVDGLAEEDTSMEAAVVATPEEAIDFTAQARQEILQDASEAIASQANFMDEAVLALLEFGDWSTSVSEATDPFTTEDASANSADPSLGSDVVDPSANPPADASVANDAWLMANSEA